MVACTRHRPESPPLGWEQPHAVTSRWGVARTGPRLLSRTVNWSLQVLGPQVAPVQAQTPSGDAPRCSPQPWLCPVSQGAPLGGGRARPCAHQRPGTRQRLPPRAGGQAGLGSVAAAPVWTAWAWHRDMPCWAPGTAAWTLKTPAWPPGWRRPAAPRPCRTDLPQRCHRGERAHRGPSASAAPTTQPPADRQEQPCGRELARHLPPSALSDPSGTPRPCAPLRGGWGLELATRRAPPYHSLGTERPGRDAGPGGGRHGQVPGRCF